MTSMIPQDEVTNVVFAGLGGQGILKASDILAEAAFRSGFDVKKSEVHGMSQRGGFVTSDVRFGKEVYSPMVPEGEAHFLAVLEMTQIDSCRHLLRQGGVLITPEVLLQEGQTIEDTGKNPAMPITRRTLNVALVGVLSAFLDLPQEYWIEALRGNLPAKVHAINEEVFALGRQRGDLLRHS